MNRNILVTIENLIKLADFDISNDDSDNTQDTDNSLTQSVGSPGYMSPEMVNSSKYDFKTDIWLIYFLNKFVLELVTLSYF